MRIPATRSSDDRTGPARRGEPSAACASRRPAGVALALAGLCLLGALVLRVWALDGQTLSWDEGNNAFFALQSPAGILHYSRATLDTNPPAHRLALGLWLRLLGGSARNLRLLSSLLGVALLVPVYLWGSRLSGQRVGLVAAALTALSPMLVYYSREAKGYPFAALFGLLALYVWVRYLDDGTPVSPMAWAAYVLAEALACGAHYYAVLLFIAQGVWLAADVIADRTRRHIAWRRLGRWLAAQLAAAMLVAPWVVLTLPTALRGARDASTWAPLSLPAYLADLGMALSAGAQGSRWAAAAAIVILAIGCVSALWRGPWRHVGLPAAAVVVPVALGFVAQRRIAFFSPRFLLFVVPPLLLLAALGLCRWRRAGMVLGAALALAWLPGLWEITHPTIQLEEDLRPLAQTLRTYALPGDGVIVGYIWQEGNLRLLAPGIPVRYYLGWFSQDGLDREMEKLVAAHRRLWLVTYQSPLQHPQNMAGWWLEQHAARALVTESGYGRVVLYVSPEATGCGPAVAQFEDGISLSCPRVDADVAPGRALPISLCWEVEAAPAAGYSVFVHLYDETGTLRAQSDGVPVNGLRPFPQLPPREPVGDPRALWLPPDLPPGVYQLAVGVYDAGTGKRLNVIAGAAAGKDSVAVGTVRIGAGVGER